MPPGRGSEQREDIAGGKSEDRGARPDVINSGNLPVHSNMG